MTYKHDSHRESLWIDTCKEIFVIFLLMTALLFNAFLATEKLEQRKKHEAHRH